MRHSVALDDRTVEGKEHCDAPVWELTGRRKKRFENNRCCVDGA
jgi:hypothetical protein